MKERILEFLITENKSSAQLAEEIGVQPSSISHITSGRNNPSLDFVMKMLTKYPSLSSDWLLFGKGKMYHEPQLNDLFNIASEESGIESRIISGKRPDNDYAVKETRSPTDTGPCDERKTGSKDNTTKRIICFFSDDTFKEYFPGQG